MGDRGHHTSKRTLERDLHALATEYPIDCDASTKPYGWRWRKGEPRIGIAGMDLAQALSFYMVEQHLAALMPDSVAAPLKPYFADAKRRVNQHQDPAPLRNWPQRMKVVTPGQPQLSPKVLPLVHDAVTHAVLGGTQLTIKYHTQASAELKTAPCHPLGLVQHGRAIYLAARLFDYPDVRLLALHRIKSAVEISAPASAPAGFDLDAWVQQGALGFGRLFDAVDADIQSQTQSKNITLVADFYGTAAKHLCESPLSADQTATAREDGSSRITATVQADRRLLWWLRGFGADVRVIAPLELVARVRADLNGVLGRYGAGESA